MDASDADSGNGPILYSWVTSDGSRIRWSADPSAADSEANAKPTPRKRVGYCMREGVGIYPSCHASKNRKEFLRRYYALPRKVSVSPKAIRTFEEMVTVFTLDWLVGNID